VIDRLLTCDVMWHRVLGAAGVRAASDQRIQPRPPPMPGPDGPLHRSGDLPNDFPEFAVVSVSVTALLPFAHDPSQSERRLIQPLNRSVSGTLRAFSGLGPNLNTYPKSDPIFNSNMCRAASSAGRRNGGRARRGSRLASGASTTRRPGCQATRTCCSGRCAAESWAAASHARNVARSRPQRRMHGAWRAEKPLLVCELVLARIWGSVKLLGQTQPMGYCCAATLATVQRCEHLKQQCYQTLTTGH